MTGDAHHPSSTVLRWRKKPVVIEAWQFSPYLPYTDLPGWIHLAWLAEEIELDANGRERRGARILQIPTLEGVMTARIGDYIIRGVKGEVYPCKPDIFEATYEPVQEASHAEDPAIGQRTTEDGQEDRSASVPVGPHGHSAQQEASEPETT